MAWTVASISFSRHWFWFRFCGSFVPFTHFTWEQSLGTISSSTTMNNAPVATRSSCHPSFYYYTLSGLFQWPLVLEYTEALARFRGTGPIGEKSLQILKKASSAGCVTSCVSPTAPRTRWSSSRPSGARTPAPSPASSELSKDSIKILLCCCLPPYWHSRQNLPLEYIYCLPLLFVWIALLMIERQTSCQKFLYTSDLKILKYLSTVSYFSMFSKTLPIYTFSSHL